MGGTFADPELSPEKTRKSQRTFENFIAKFKAILRNPKSSPKEITLAIQVLNSVLNLPFGVFTLALSEVMIVFFFSYRDTVPWLQLASCIEATRMCSS